MARRRNRFEDDDGAGGADSLDLAPFMNMAMILIPMLLLSVVFLKVGVIDVSTPKLAPESTAGSDAKDAPSPTVAIGADGFRVATVGRVLEPSEGCPADGPTVCLADPAVDVQAKVRRVRKLFREGKSQRAEAVLEEVAGAYDFAELYNRLRAFKDDHPEASKLRVSASSNLPYALLVRVMDAVRYRLEGDEEELASNAEFWEANAAAEQAGGRAALFDKPVLAVGK